MSRESEDPDDDLGKAERDRNCQIGAGSLEASYIFCSVKIKEHMDINAGLHSSNEIRSSSNEYNGEKLWHKQDSKIDPRSGAGKRSAICSR
jgi:hypothetical protein